MPILESDFDSDAQRSIEAIKILMPSVPIDPYTLAAKAIAHDIALREGLDIEWEAIESSVKRDIIMTWRAVIRLAMEKE